MALSRLGRLVMIGAVMKSMDPALEEASQVMGASRLRTMLRVRFRWCWPACSAPRCSVFAEMLGSFAGGARARPAQSLYVVTTRSIRSCSSIRPRSGRPPRWARRCFAVMFVTLFIYRRIITAGST